MHPLPTSRKPHQRRKEARPSELLEAALDLFVEKGFAATRLEDVAAHAGVSKGTLYLYFDSKAALLKAVVVDGIMPLLDQTEDIITNFAGSATELLRHLMLTSWAQLGENRMSGICKLVLAEASNFPDIAAYFHTAVIERGQGLIQKALEIGIERGEFRKVDTAVAADSIFAPMLKLILWQHSFSGCCGIQQDPRAYLEKHLDIVFNGMRLA